MTKILSDYSDKRFSYCRNVMMVLDWPHHNFFSREVKRFIVAQFALESNYGSSRLASAQHNHCGMKLPKKRLTYALSEENGFAKYASLHWCILDYISLMIYNGITQEIAKDVDLFSNFLQKIGYCPDANYISNIYQIYLQIPHNV